MDAVYPGNLESFPRCFTELGVVFEPATLDGLQFTPLYNDRFVAVVPASGALADKDELSWTDLLTQPFITLQRPSAVRLLLE